MSVPAGTAEVKTVRAPTLAGYNPGVPLRSSTPARGLAALAAFATGLLWALGSVSVARPVPPLPAGLPPTARVWLAELADTADVVTQVEAEPFVGRREVFEYLLDHPEFATHITRTLRLARYRIWSTPEGLFLDDGWGARGHFWVLHAARGTRVMRARGEYRNGLLPSIRGEAATMIEYQTAAVEGGLDLIQATVTGFLRLDSRLLALVMKLAGSAAQRKADLEAHRLMKVFARTSQALEENPAGVWAALAERPDVPRQELAEFARLLNLR